MFQEDGIIQIQEFEALNDSFNWDTRSETYGTESGDKMFLFMLWK